LNPKQPEIFFSGLFEGILLDFQGAAGPNFLPFQAKAALAVENLILTG